MNDSAFNPDLFEAQVVEDANETNRTPIPAGMYSATIDEYKFEEVDTKAGKRVILRVTWEIYDDELRQSMGRDKITVRQDIWLDVEGGSLKFGANQNIGLGRLRAALGQNTPGKAWGFHNLSGAGPVNIEIAHRHDKNDETLVYDEVKRVVAQQ